AALIAASDPGMTAPTEVESSRTRSSISECTAAGGGMDRQLATTLRNRRASMSSARASRVCCPPVRQSMVRSRVRSSETRDVGGALAPPAALGTGAFYRLGRGFGGLPHRNRLDRGFGDWGRGDGLSRWWGLALSLLLALLPWYDAEDWHHHAPFDL